MAAVFKTPTQERLFSALLHALGGIGYGQELTAKWYRFSDWFEPTLPERETPAAYFGSTPFSYDSACLCVLLSNGHSGASLVQQYRALGAPLAFEVRTDRIRQWIVGAEPTTTIARGDFGLDEIEGVVSEHLSQWSPAAVLRAKNVPLKLGQRQLDFIDIGLLPALEQQIREKLDRLLKEALQEAFRALTPRQRTANAQEIFQLVFRVLAAKILHDRDVPGFASLSSDQVDTVLERVTKHYGDSLTPIGSLTARRAIAERLWTQLDFKNLSVEALACIYENTLVDQVSRKQLGTHSTPAAIARYIVRRLAFESFAEEERRVLEPCSGHGIFLVAALQRLRELLPPHFDSKERHRYFVKLLQGYEIDSFALEVSKLCLVLADFPNPNGWKLYLDDVFLSDRLTKELRHSRIILCNPPFEDFTTAERKKYGDLESVQKPAELLRRILRDAHSSAILGIVLPRQFIDGKAYRDIRRQIAERFENIEVVALPDGIFHNADQETSLLLAQNPRAESGRVSFSFAQVTEKGCEEFLERSTVTRRESASRTPDQLADSMSLPLFGELWERLATNPTLGDIAEIHRGVEWQPPFDQAKYISSAPKAGFERGLLKITPEFAGFVDPQQRLYLSTRPADRRREAFDHPWDQPKVIANAATLSRGMWRLAAFADRQGWIFSQRFHAIWPKRDGTTAFIEAVLNGPVANAYVVAYEGKRDIKKSTLSRIPIPTPEPSLVQILDILCEQLRDHLKKNNSRLTNQALADWQAKGRNLLLAIDAVLLRAYDLPPRLERELLDAFEAEARRVPFPFTEYYEADFTPQLPLWMLVSPEYDQRNAAHLRKNLPRITDPALISALVEVE
jgi:hypothetical protein